MEVMNYLNYNLHAGDEIPQLQSPWNVNDFINENGNIAKLPENILSSNLMSIHLNFLYAKITEMIRDQPKRHSTMESVI